MMEEKTREFHDYQGCVNLNNCCAKYERIFFFNSYIEQQTYIHFLDKFFLMSSNE